MHCPLRELRSSALACVMVAALGACQPPPTPGSVCTANAQCVSPLSCRFGRCRSACAVDRDCPSGASCLLDADGIGACSVETDLGCETGVGRMCPSGLVCVADRCAQTCSTAIGCATGSVCVPFGGAVSFCAPQGSDASVPSDAAPVDAAGTTACDHVIDLTLLDAGAGPLAYHTDTSGTPAAPTFSLSCVTSAGTAHQIVLRYRMRQTRFLRVDTGVGLTSPLYDTVVGIFDTCDAAAVPTICSDDYDGDLRARAQSTSALSQGTDVYIVIGAIDPPATGNLTSGTLDLTIEEVAVASPHGACDPHGLTSICVGSACATISTGVATCLIEQPEVEPDAHDSPQPVDVTTPIVMAGLLEPSDEDCFELAVSAGQSIVATTSNGLGECPRYGIPLTLSLTAVGASTPLVSVTGDDMSNACPPIDGTTSTPAHGLAAGNYVVCLSTPTGFLIDHYDLALSLL